MPDNDNLFTLPMTDTNLILQYTAVAILIVAAICRIILSIRRRNKQGKKGGSCHGCSLADACKDYRRPEHKSGRDTSSRDCHK